MPSPVRPLTVRGTGCFIGGVLGIGIAYGGSKVILYLAFHNGVGPTKYVPVDASPS